MKKRLVSALLTATMVVGMMTGVTSYAEEAKEYDVIYLSCSTASEFWQYIGIGIQNAALDFEAENGIKVNLQVTGPAEESQTEAYVTSFEEAIAAMPDAIVTATQVADATVPKATEAVGQGIVLNFVNCGLSTPDVTDYDDIYNQFYYCSNETIGRLAAETMLAKMKEKGIEPKGTIAMNFSVVNETLAARMTGFSDYMAENAPDIVCTETFYNDNNLETAQANVENQISTYGDELVGIYGGQNISADGACLAAAAANISDKVAVVGVDSDATEIEALENGTLDAIVVQDAYAQGYAAMENALLTLLNGENPESEKKVNCEPVAITADNMGTDAMQALLNPTLLAK
ncbi:MAG: substrate-binding domain-containing protein [Lachnospiraceae bacterium]|nr:substrate-binding domain-containing protein [Lachnospiraceae bacterium]MDD2957800.1 substrate-binding domain-containing protein [Lachnospiraceae bacterium]